MLSVNIFREINSERNENSCDFMILFCEVNRATNLYNPLAFYEAWTELLQHETPMGVIQPTNRELLPPATDAVVVPLFSSSYVVWNVECECSWRGLPAGSPRERRERIQHYFDAKSSSWPSSSRPVAVVTFCCLLVSNRNTHCTPYNYPLFIMWLNRRV